MTPGLCECGCGQPTPFVQQTDRQQGRTKGQPSRFIWGHNMRRSTLTKYYLKRDGDREHRHIAEAILGRPLPSKSEVHHVNGVRTDNRNRNLVICEDSAYHHLLHRRQRALDECGHADWLRCADCLQLDAPENIHAIKIRRLGKSPRNRTYHVECHTTRERNRRQAKKVKPALAGDL